MSNAPRDIKKHRLSNGLVVITEPMRHVRSVTVGVWVRTGSRREPTKLNGIAHFIEHMLFKGTERRSAEQIAKEVDSVGGMLDAFTGKEMICFNTKVLDEHLPLAFDVLADLVLRPRFDVKDIEKEKGVILEEMKMDQDNPDYLIHELFTQGFWRGHALGLPILGTHLKQCHKKELEQAHLCLGVAAYPMAHERRYATALLNNILGGGMSSRLFQNIREKRGLAYAVYSDVSPYRDTGLLSIYAGTAVKTVHEVIRLVMAEFHDLKKKLVPAEELRRAKDYLKGSLMLSLESTSARMSNLARQELYFGRFVTMDEMLAAVEKVKAEEIQELAIEYFQPKRIAASVLGNLNGHKVTRAHLEC